MLLRFTQIFQQGAHRTDHGKALRATSQDRESAQLMGINVLQCYNVAFGLGCAICAVAGTIFAKIRGEDRTMYSEEVCEYLNSERFLKDNQNLYLRRLKGISQTPSAQNGDLMESYLRLIDKGYIERNPNLVIRWGAPNSRDNRIGHTSVLMKTVVMNPKLDNEDVEENVLDYALYTQICHTNLRFSPNREEDAKRYELMLADYPDGEKTRLKLAEMGIGL